MLHAYSPLNSEAWYVDAQSGQVFRKRGLMPFCGHTNHTHHADCSHKARAFGAKRFGVEHTAKTQGCTAGTGTTTFNGSQTIYTDPDNGTYRLRDDCHDGWIWTRFYGDPINNSNVTEFTDNNNIWTSANDEIGVTAHWGIRSSQDYFKFVHNRNGWNGSGQDIKVYCRRNFGDAQNPSSDASFNNATQGYVLNAKIYFGHNFNNLASDDMTPLDIAGHEYAHGVTSSESGLVYEKESGALNEGISDIFGECIEQWKTGSHNNWWHGGERVNSGGFQIGGRNMQDPNAGISQQQPDTYLGTNWVNTNCGSPDKSNDQCGVHTNSGVLNKAFFLMVDGESGVNDNGDPYEVQGIGFSKARKIVYHAQMNYLTSHDEYVDAREAFIQSAEDFYGLCSNEAIQVAKAFYAVGVGSGSSSYDKKLCGIIIPSGSFSQVEGVRSITSGGTNCTSSVTPNGSGFLFKAGLEVVFKDNFAAPVGSNIQVITNDCSLTKD
ncbi:MAG: M4 family metallopeptidase [Bacteroidia bacterium]